MSCVSPKASHGGQGIDLRIQTVAEFPPTNKTGVIVTLLYKRGNGGSKR